MSTKLCLIVLLVFLINSCCISIFQEQNLSLNHFENKIQNINASNDFFIIYNISNYSNCDPVDYFKFEFSDTSYVLFENKNQKYFEIFRYLDFKMCSKEKVGIIKKEYTDIINLINLFKKEKNNLELKYYYDKNITFNQSLNPNNNYILIVKGSTDLKIDNCNNNNADGLYLLKNMITIINKNKS